jgi:hypothetical protein
MSEAIEEHEEIEDVHEAGDDEVVMVAEDIDDQDAREALSRGVVDAAPAKRKTKLKLVKPPTKAKKTAKVVKAAVKKVAKKVAAPVKAAKAKTKAVKSTKPAAKPVAKVAKVTKAIKQAASGGAKIVKKATKAPIARAARKSTKSAAIHVRELASKTSPTLCGGSHSPIWNRSGDKPLETVGPQQAKQGTCGRCVRVAKARRMI